MRADKKIGSLHASHFQVPADHKYLPPISGQFPLLSLPTPDSLAFSRASRLTFERPDLDLGSAL